MARRRRGKNVGTVNSDVTDQPLALRSQAANALATIARLLAESLDPREVAVRIAESVGQLLDPVATAVYELTAAGDLVPIAVVGDPGPTEGALTWPRGTGLGAVAVAERATVTTDDLLKDPRVRIGEAERAHLERAIYRAALAAPLLAHGRVVGVLGLGLRSDRIIDDEARRTVEAFADHAALALDNARLYAEAARGQREAEVIAEVARAINAALDINAILPLVADAARSLTGADTASIALREAGGDALVFRHHSGQRYRGYDDVRIAPTAGLSGRVVSSARAARSDDVRADPAIDRAAREVLDAEGLVSLLIAPIAFGGRVEGLLYVGNRRPVPFGAQDESLVQRLADQAATALRNVNLFAAEQTARAAAEAANRMKDDFLATVSHELRTPLTAMLGWIWWLRRGPADASVQGRALETVERNARAQAQLVEDLLDVSRIVTGKLRLAVRPADLRDVIDAAIDSVRTAADGKGVRLETRLPAHAITVAVDPDRLQQVVWNLLSNAIKFTPEGGQVDVTLESSPGEARIVVADTGSGISPAFLPYVFDRFRQAEASSTRAYGGLGLGLAIVRHLVELHGGTVRAASAGEGQGTTFTVTLPTRAGRRTMSDDAVARLRGARRTARPRSPALEGVRVLLVEDDPDARELIMAVLSQHGARVTAVDSAGAARGAFARGVPDILISDIGMRGEDGYTLIREVRRRPDASRVVPAVALTAYAGDEDRRRALHEGYDVHVAKPVDPDELVAVLADLAPPARRVEGRAESA